MTVRIFNRYLSCIQWTPWYQKKVTNWDSLFLLVGNYSVLSLRSMFFLTDGILTCCFRFFFRSRSIKILFPFFNQHRMIKIVHDGKKLFNKHFIYLPLFIIIEVLFVDQMHSFLNMQLVYGVCYRDNFCVFCHEKSVSSW